MHSKPGFNKHLFPLSNTFDWNWSGFLENNWLEPVSPGLQPGGLNWGNFFESGYSYVSLTLSEGSGTPWWCSPGHNPNCSKWMPSPHVVFPTFYSNRSLSHCKIQLVRSVGEALLFHRNNQVSIPLSSTDGRDLSGCVSTYLAKKKKKRLSKLLMWLMHMINNS